MKLGALLFIDQSWRNRYFATNAEFESVIPGPTETEAEFAIGGVTPSSREPRIA